jgi:hypothetical protein
VRAIFVVVIGIVFVGCVGQPPKKADLSGTADSHVYLALDGGADYKTVYDKLPLTDDKKAVADNNCLPLPKEGEKPRFVAGPPIGALVAAGVDWYFSCEQAEIDAWKKAVSATYSNRIYVTRDILTNSKCLIAVRVDTDPTKGPAYADNQKDLVAIFAVGSGGNYFILAPIYIRVGRSVAATSVVDGHATVDTSFALSLKGVTGKADEPPAFKDLGSGTTTVAKVELGAAGMQKGALTNNSMSTDMIPLPPASVSPISLTLAVSETGHPSDVDQLSAENKAMQTAVGAVLKAATPSGK